MTVMDVVEHHRQLIERYRQCFEWFTMLNELREWLPEEDIPHMEAELRLHGLPLPGEPGAEQTMQDARTVFDEWDHKRAARMAEDSANWMSRMAQNCPYC